VTEPVLILAPNPSIYTGRGTNTYLVGDGPGLLCIDPGPDDATHLEAVLDAAAARASTPSSRSVPTTAPGRCRTASGCAPARSCSR
jgi:hypothetical protein